MKTQSTKWKRYCKITDEVRIVEADEVSKSVEFHVLNYKKTIKNAKKGTELETTNAVFIKQ